MHSKVINPVSKSILVINPFLPNFAQCAVTIWNAEDCVPAAPTPLGIVPPLASPMTLSPVWPSRLAPVPAQPASKGSAARTAITKTIRDIAHIAQGQRGKCLVHQGVFAGSQLMIRKNRYDQHQVKRDRTYQKSKQHCADETHRLPPGRPDYL